MDPIWSLELKIGSLESEKIIIGSQESEKIGSLFGGRAYKICMTCMFRCADTRFLR